MTIYGHGAARDAFGKSLQEQRIHHAWLFAGPRGVGKASLASDFAIEMLVRAVEPECADAFAHPIGRMVQAGTHPDYKYIARLVKDEKTGDLARSIVVEQIRQLNNSMTTKPAMSARRVVVIDAAEDFEVNAANALLKSLEEPPAGTIFLLISHAPGRLLPTIRSRCRLLNFARLDETEMQLALSDVLPELPETDRSALLPLAEGAPGKAVQLATLDMPQIDAVLQNIATGGDPSNAQRLKLAKSLSPKAAQARYEAFLARVPQFIAEYARKTSPSEMDLAVQSWEAASKLARSAVPQSLDPQIVTFALLGHVATLAPANGAAKA